MSALPPATGHANGRGPAPGADAPGMARGLLFRSNRHSAQDFPLPGMRTPLTLASRPAPDCATCPHHALRIDRQCVPGDICARAHSGRQIDRFLRRHPELAADYLTDGFWERRAIAARYAPLADVRARIHDSDEVVRRAVALRLPADELDALSRDGDREVRITVAARLPPERLGTLMGDPDYLVRQTVAERLPHGRLSAMVRDPDREVRKAVARRLPAFALGRLADDADAEVRRIAASRMLPADAARMLADEDWLVRLEAARRAEPTALTVLLDDPEVDVRDLARERLQAITTHEEPR